MLQRVRRRYLALKTMSEQAINKWDLMNALWNAIHTLFGEYGASQVNLNIIEHNSKITIIRCSHNALEMVRASIASITKINEKSVAIHVVRVSGTLKSLREKMSSKI